VRIPPSAVKTGDLSFFEGCWLARRPAHPSERISGKPLPGEFLLGLLSAQYAYAICGTIITERFCFDKNGNGRRTIQDPGLAGTCTGASRGRFDAQGRLIVTSEQGYCTGGAVWGPADMVCEGEGNATPCFWRFPGLGGATQSYRISLVRE
jgi:hypothetical protein